MTRRTTLPLGIDVGAVRTRVALVELDDRRRPAIVAVAARETGADPASAMRAAREELRTRERRCVLALTAPDAALRVVAFPRMGARERLRAARFEAARVIGASHRDAAVRIASERDGACVVTVARRAALAVRTSAARRAGLQPIAVDDAAFALLRAFPHAGAIVDVGETATVLTVPAVPIPIVRVVATGSGALTDALGDALGLGRTAAGERKHAHGLGGAATVAFDALIDALASAIAAYRASAAADVRDVVLTGNGARLAGLADALARATAVPVTLGALDADAAPAYPRDVVRAASPDWGLAYGLALWSDAA